MSMSAVEKGLKFENDVIEILTDAGLKAWRTNKTNSADPKHFRAGFDGGVDIIAEFTANEPSFKECNFYIQCKCHKKRLTISAICEAYGGMHVRKCTDEKSVAVVFTSSGMSNETILYAKELNVEIISNHEMSIIEKAKKKEKIPYVNCYGKLLKAILYHYTKDTKWIEALPNSKYCNDTPALRNRIIGLANTEFNRSESYNKNAFLLEREAYELRLSASKFDDKQMELYEKAYKLDCEAYEKRQIAFEIEKSAVNLVLQSCDFKFNTECGKFLLKFLADNQSYYDFLNGLDNLTDEQKQVLFERLKSTLKLPQLKEPVKIINPNVNVKPHSVIECCLHCGSISIIKHGTTKGGVQRYLCKDCKKTFSENYGLITHCTHLSEWQWFEAIRGIVVGESVTAIAKNMKVSPKTAWLCRLKVYQSLKNIYEYGDTFNSIVEIDGKYERISFKGHKDKKFFIHKLGRMPRHHRSMSERIEYLGSYESERLRTENPKLYKEMIYGKLSKMLGRATISINHQHCCILTAIDRSNNIYIQPITSGTPESVDICKYLTDRISKEAIIVTDDHRSYKHFIHKEKIKHVCIKRGKHSDNTFSLGRVNALHSAIDKFFSSPECMPATKYIDLYMMMFWWLKKNNAFSSNELTNKLFNMMTCSTTNESRAKMTIVTFMNLTKREMPIDTKGCF